MTHEETEARRLERQAALDADRSAKERNELGQFATPPGLAEEIVREALRFADENPLSFFDPAIGSGAFYSALLRLAGSRIAQARGVEIDERFARASQQLWGRHGLEVINNDFTRLDAPSGGIANLLIANPPYVRHHHLSTADKSRLQRAVSHRLGIETSGLAGLYVYFMLLSHAWMREGGVAAWLVPSEWMAVNYGAALRRYLTEHVTLLRLHFFDANDVQFGDALVSSSVVFLRKQRPGRNATVRVTVGGDLESPEFAIDPHLETLRAANKWTAVVRRAIDGISPPVSRTSISVLFRIRRGIATGRNPFFIRPLSEWDSLGVARECLRPVLPPSRTLNGLLIQAGPDGYPNLPDPLALLDCSLPPDEVRAAYPGTWAYLNSPEAAHVRETYLARHRTPWYAQEARPVAPFISTYMGRGRKGAAPFRFFANRSQAIATNSYLMLYPRAGLEAHLRAHPTDDVRVAEVLQEIAAGSFRTHGREYGGGLHKLEPSEVAALPADPLIDEFGLTVDSGAQCQLFAS